VGHDRNGHQRYYNQPFASQSECVAFEAANQNLIIVGLACVER